MPKHAKPFKGIGSGVLELALRYASDAYRVVLAVQIGEGGENEIATFGFVKGIIPAKSVCTKPVQWGR
jgi:hypothetical protein